MQVHNSITRCTAFLGYPTERGFCPAGTGFFVSIDQDGVSFGYFVTAAHLVWPNRSRVSSKKLPNGPIYIRYNSKTDKPILDKTNDDEWIFPTDKTLDVCALPVGVPWQWQPPDEENEYDDVFPLNLSGMTLTDEKANSLGFALGDDVAITGAFVGRVGEKRNIPIVRVANIAAMPQEPIFPASQKRGAYLIETRSLGGTSGSPIFLKIGTNRETSFKEPPISSVATGNLKKPIQRSVILPYLLVGMILGSHSGQYASEFISEDDTDIKPSKDVEFNAGISVAMSAVDILDFLENDVEPLAGRNAMIDKMKEDSGYRPSSASTARKAASNANPNHLEDFNHLVDVAARKRKQDDQS